MDTTCTKMTIGDVLKQWCTMPEETLEWVGVKLHDKLCPVSNSSVNAFQSSWDSNRPYEDFQLAQQNVLKECVKVEVSKFGEAVRQATGMAGPISMDTVLYKDLDAEVDAEAERSEYEDNMGEGEI